MQKRTERRRELLSEGQRLRSESHCVSIACKTKSASFGEVGEVRVSAVGQAQRPGHGPKVVHTQRNKNEASRFRDGNSRRLAPTMRTLKSAGRDCKVLMVSLLSDLRKNRLLVTEGGNTSSKRKTLPKTKIPPQKREKIQ